MVKAALVIGGKVATYETIISVVDKVPRGTSSVLESDIFKVSRGLLYSFPLLSFMQFRNCASTVPLGVPFCLLWKLVNNRWSSLGFKTKGYLQDRPVDPKTCASVSVTYSIRQIIDFVRNGS